ncbi:MAG: transposase, partial [Staphylococcus epidermidis]|nr:transposase [Staphylococcus epidermidis]
MVTNTAWNPGKQTFNIPSGKDMAWAKVSQQKVLEIKMNKINHKLKDGKKLNKNDIFTIIAYQQQKHSNVLPKSVQKYIDEHASDISNDLTASGSTQLMEQYGNFLKDNPGLTLNGKNFKDYGVGIAKVGKYGGKGITAVGFASGMYTDISEDNKTVGEAVAHNSLTTGAGIGAGVVAGAFLATTPPGIAITGVIVIGTGVTLFSEAAYKNNWLGIKTGTDWVG